MNIYRITRIRSGFWIVKNLYQELVYEGHSFSECKAWISNRNKRSDNLVCPLCHNECHITGLIGPTTDDCPVCGKRVL